jgi:16S rRNA (guanine966-N2)-methyltransferase
MESARRSRTRRRPLRSAAGRNELRIVGGLWRGRRLAFPEAAGLRPTPDRVRETLFNWLQPVICGARCLDLYAGSGALGLEAASRGAAEVVLVEHSRAVAERLREHAASLGAQGVQVVEADALAYLQGPVRPFDVVFLDPPFGHNLLAPSCRLLDERGWVRAGSHVYLEHAVGEPLPQLPLSWQLARSKAAGQVAYHLALRTAGAGTEDIPCS